jgi:hypothetical protein
MFEITQGDQAYGHCRFQFIAMDPAQFAAFQKLEMLKWAKTIKDANIKVE